MPSVFLQPTTATEVVLLGLRYESTTDRAATTEDVRVVMRDFRLWSRAAWLLNDKLVVYWDMMDPSLGADPRGYWSRAEPDSVIAEEVRSTPYPLVRAVRSGSLIVALDLTPLVVAVGGLALVGRFLYLVERYWHLPLRLKVQRAELEKELERARTLDGPPDSPVQVALTLASASSGEPDEEPQKTSELMRVVDGVVAATLEEFESD